MVTKVKLRRKQKNKLNGLTIFLLLVIAALLVSNYMAFTSGQSRCYTPEGEKTTGNISGYSSSVDGCFDGKPCVTDESQTVMIEYYSENSFDLVVRNKETGEKEKRTVSTVDLMKEFNEQDVDVNLPPEERPAPESDYRQYLCLSKDNAATVSCIPASIFW